MLTLGLAEALFTHSSRNRGQGEERIMVKLTVTILNKVVFPLFFFLNPGMKHLMRTTNSQNN
jgi:hypothetical protein